MTFIPDEARPANPIPTPGKAEHEALNSLPQDLPAGTYRRKALGYLRDAGEIGKRHDALIAQTAAQQRDVGSPFDIAIEDARAQMTILLQVAMIHATLAASARPV